MMCGEPTSISHVLAVLPQLQALRKAHAGVQFLLEVARMHCDREEQLAEILATQRIEAAHDARFRETEHPDGYRLMMSSQDCLT